MISRFMPRKFLESKLSQEQSELAKVKALHALIQKANKKSIEQLFATFDDPSPNVRNYAARALATIAQAKPDTLEAILKQAEDIAKTGNLAQRIVAIQLLGFLEQKESIPLLLDIVMNAGYDLQYAAISAMHYETSPDILNALGYASRSPDYITRRAAVNSVRNIVQRMPKEEWVPVLASHLHLLLDVYLEISELANVIVYILDNAEKTELPAAKGYKEFDLIKMRKMLEKFEYSKYVYENLWTITFPAYHPLEEGMTRVS